ncbi:MAG: hypothetical protein ACI90A_001234 [Shewanella sp.]|jgi:hypothetical protein
MTETATLRWDRSTKLRLDSAVIGIIPTVTGIDIGQFWLTLLEVQKLSL